MNRSVRTLLLAVAVLVTASRSEAVPILQLGIVGGYYDETTETIISNGPTFDLVALITPGTSGLDSTYHISAALTPQTASQTSVGSFTWTPNGGSTQTIDVTGDMVYGVPPLEANLESDSGDLPRHGIYPTYFTEFSFNSAGLRRTQSYNTAEDPGRNPVEDPSGDAYFQTFTISTNLADGFQLHFDLYDTFFRSQCRRRTCTSDTDIDHFAPFSHDAESGDVPPVPEPASVLLLSGGLGLVARKLRRNGQQ